MEKKTDPNVRRKEDRERVQKIIQGMSLFDDDLMSRVFETNKKATELVLGIP